MKTHSCLQLNHGLMFRPALWPGVAPETATQRRRYPSAVQYHQPRSPGP